MTPRMITARLRVFKEQRDHQLRILTNNETTKDEFLIPHRTVYLLYCTEIVALEAMLEATK